jgi:hypothetical protein
MRVHRVGLLLMGLIWSLGAFAEQAQLARAFESARKVRAFERLQLVASLASSAELAKGMQGGAKGATLLPPEDALPNVEWVAVVNAAGDRLAARGEAPVDLGRRATVQKALSAFLRDDLIASPNGPLFVAAAPIGANGKVIGALVVAWPEALQLESFARESCGCQAMLVVNESSTTGDLLPPAEVSSLIKSFQADKTQIRQASAKKMAAFVPLAGELTGAAYLLLFEEKSAPAITPAAPPKDHLPQILVLASSLLLGVVLLLMLRASKKEKMIFDEASLLLQIPTLYQDFVDAKTRCGEPIDAVTLDRFSLKVRESCALFSRAYNHPRIKVAVNVKNGRAQLVATPV